MKLYFKLSIIFLFFGHSGMSQIPDTIMVYDTIYVYDTIRINKIEKNALSKINIANAVLEIDTATMNARLVILYDQKSATIPINGIILNENIKNLNDMKKICLKSIKERF